MPDGKVLPKPCTSNTLSQSKKPIISCNQETILKSCFDFAKEKGRSEEIAPSYQLYLAIKLEILQIRSSGCFRFDECPDFFLNFLGLCFDLFVLCFVGLFEFSDQLLLFFFRCFLKLFVEFFTGGV